MKENRSKSDHTRLCNVHDSDEDIDCDDYRRCDHQSTPTCVDRLKTPTFLWLLALALLTACIISYGTWALMSRPDDNIMHHENLKHVLVNYPHETYGRKNEYQNPSGTVWPLPQMLQSSASVLLISPEEFTFEATDETCDILKEAFARYHSLIFYPPRLLKFEASDDDARIQRNENYLYLRSLQVSLKIPCEIWPSSSMDEKYELKINADDLPGNASLTSESVWGLLRGLETFSQLIYLNEKGQFQVNGTHIIDFPRFSFRGILFDTGRHYLTKKIIFENLEAMAQNKFNVFHWHLVDDPSFPYQSKAIPALSEKGAFTQRDIYTPEDVEEILEFARMRGIRVIPEFDTPGHTTSWGRGLPDLVTPCYKDGIKTDSVGPINPTLNATYKTLKEFFTEVTQVFPDKYVHLGGDEVDFSCWNTNPQVSAFMNENGFRVQDLKAYYFKHFLNVFQNKTRFIVWSDALDGGVSFPPDVIIHVWTNDYKEKLGTVTSMGFHAILSSCWYLDETRGTSFADWNKLYVCEPQDFSGRETQVELVIGGEACMWGESVDNTNVMTRVWPRASAVAERLWSAKSVSDTNEALPRLAEHQCRMLYRGIDAEPQPGPGHCNVDLNKL